MSQVKYQKLLTRASDELSRKLLAATETKFVTPSEWLQKHYYIPKPRDIHTGDVLPQGPIQLASHQIRIIDEALSRNDDGTLKYSTIIYSAPKKSGKSAIASGISMYIAEQNPFGRIYCIANDENQSSERLYGPIKTCILLHQKFEGIFKDLSPTKRYTFFDNMAKIEAIPCDAVGEAGSEPLAVFWSEIWGFMGSDKKKQLWTEMTIPPTNFGYSFRWVESYAGFVGQSDILENLYNTSVKDGSPHPDFMDLKGRDGEPVVLVNERAGTFAYWDTAPRMVWQHEEYYTRQASLLLGPEFERVHRNQWISPIGQFIQSEWLEACANPNLPDLVDSKIPCIVAIDAATEEDCAAIVLVTRDPFNPASEVAVRDCRIFRPTPGHSIILSQTVGKVIEEWGEKYNIVCIAYDAYQMKKLAQDYRRGIVDVSDKEIQGLSPDEIKAYIKKKVKAVQVWYKEFSQHGARAIADKQLQSMILSKQISFKPNTPGIDRPRTQDSLEYLTLHLTQAGKKLTGDKLRLSKLSNELKIDAAVALSMAASVCLSLDITNNELDVHALERSFAEGRISHEEFTNRMILGVSQ